MKAVPRTSRLASLLVLPLALWSAAPSIRWCSIPWSAFPECLVQSASGAPDRCGDDREEACAAGARCGGEAGAGCDADGGEVWGWGFLCDPACDAAGDPSAAASRAPVRRFCIRGPAGGEGVRPSLIDGSSPPPPHALPVAALELVADAPRRGWLEAPERARGPTIPQVALPPVRAPPLVRCEVDRPPRDRAAARDIRIRTNGGFS